MIKRRVNTYNILFKVYNDKNECIEYSILKEMKFDHYPTQYEILEKFKIENNNKNNDEYNTYHHFKMFPKSIILRLSNYIYIYVESIQLK